jgi:hypothetical protein
VTTDTIVAWIGAATAAITIILSVLLLAYRVGRLTGTMETRMSQSEADRTRIWERLGAIADKLDRHVETPHRSIR